jgi:hypothetical protein
LSGRRPGFPNALDLTIETGAALAEDSLTKGASRLDEDGSFNKSSACSGVFN